MTDGEVLDTKVVDYNYNRAGTLKIKIGDTFQTVKLIWANQLVWVKPYLAGQKALNDGR